MSPIITKGCRLLGLNRLINNYSTITHNEEMDAMVSFCLFCDDGIGERWYWNEFRRSQSSVLPTVQS